MSTVGIVSIALGVLVILTRGYTLVAPAPTLHWFRKTVGSDSRMRAFGVIGAALGGILIWAGASEDTGLADVVTFIGWVLVVGFTALWVLLPGAYRSMVNATAPEDTNGFLTFVRIKGMSGVIIGVLLVYFGVRSL